MLRGADAIKEIRGTAFRGKRLVDDVAILSQNTKKDRSSNLTLVWAVSLFLEWNC